MRVTTEEKCGICGDKMRLQRVEVIRSRDGRIYVFKDVPAKVCVNCGERFYSSEVVGRMDDIIKSGREGEKIEATRFAFPEKEAA
jgi:YgiT-type zinc finger domain-containing protein